MNDQQIHTVLKLAERGSFAKAASDLFISPQGAKDRLDALEGELGVTLFDRSNRGLALTSNGKVFCDHAEELLHHMRSFMSAVTAGAGERPLRMLVWEDMQIDNIDEACDTFLQKHPHIGIEYVFASNRNFLDIIRYGEADVALCSDEFLDPQDKDLAALHCPGMHMGYNCLIRSDHPLATGHETIDVEDLAEYKVCFASKARPSRYLSSVKIDEVIPVERHRITEWCQAGGICIIYDHYVFQRSGIARVPLAVPSEPISCVYRKPASSVVESFIDQFR